MCDYVLPVLSEVTKQSEAEAANEDLDVQLDVLKLFAELCAHCGEMEQIENRLGKLYNKLIVCHQVHNQDFFI